MEDQADEASEAMDPSELRIIGKLGSGCQAEVFEVQHSRTKQRFALKIIKTVSLTEKERQRAEFQVNSNLFISRKVESHHFPLTYNSWTSPTSINILFELCQGNAETGFRKLSSYVSRYNYLVVMLFDMLSALGELQKMSIIHRDIKPENILLKDGVFKLADLGLSRLSDKRSSHLTNDIGNRLGRSPEFISGRYNLKTDIWSLGVHIFYLLESTLPFDEESLGKIANNPNDIEKIISQPSFRVDLQASGRRSRNILSFLHLALSEMVVVDSEHRCSAKEVFETSFSLDSASEVNGTSFSLNEAESTPIKHLFVRYLEQREGFGDFYLLILLAYHQFYRMDGKIKAEPSSNKHKICLLVKETLLQIINLLLIEFSSSIASHQQLAEILSDLLTKWQSELSDEMNSTRGLDSIEEALQIYKIGKIREKFPLIEWVVKVYKTLSLKARGITGPRLNLWDIPVELYKMI